MSLSLTKLDLRDGRSFNISSSLNASFFLITFLDLSSPLIFDDEDIDDLSIVVFMLVFWLAEDFDLLLVLRFGELGAEFDLDDLDLLVELSCLIIKYEPFADVLLLLRIEVFDALLFEAGRFS